MKQPSNGDSGQCRRGRRPVWIHWGASGILQPISEEFLYRSPADCQRRTRCCTPDGWREVNDVQY